MKLGPVTKLDKRIVTCGKALTSFSFFRFTVDWNQPGIRILDAWSVILTYSLEDNVVCYRN